jgi:hypothetical protein
MTSPAGYAPDASDIVMTCRAIEVVIESVIEVLEESTSLGVPVLYEMTSSKYNVTVDSLRTPVAPFPGTIEDV